VREHLDYDESGQLLTGSFVSYHVPSAPDVPTIDVLLSEESPSPTNPLGIKGAGEGGIAGVGATIAAAVSSALDVDVTRLPLSPEAVFELVRTREQ
jgi:carbon-monoxide dehydrogenase large subunit